jgi:Cu-Zn family superoxide dismutase
MRAIAVFTNKKVQGTVVFEQESLDEPVTIELNLRGLKPNSKHGFHVHEYGDMSDECTSMCDHFNPYNQVHGGPHSKKRHVGDLGNIQADVNGNAKYQMTDSVIQLFGSKRNIIGRGLIVHADQDDLGMGSNEASKKNGNAGKRIGCAVIGYASPLKKK